MATTAAFVLMLVVYVLSWATMPRGPTGGSAVGLAFGIIGTAMMIFAALLGARRKGRTWPFLSAQTWMRGHLWIGSLSVPAILFHANFQLGGLLETVLCMALVIVVISGILGLMMQQILPRAIMNSVSVEVSEASAPIVRSLWALEAEKVLAEICGKFHVSDAPNVRQLSAEDPEIRCFRTYIEAEQQSKADRADAAAQKKPRPEWFDYVDAEDRDRAISIARFRVGGWEPRDLPAKLIETYSGLVPDSGTSNDTSKDVSGGGSQQTAAKKSLSPLEELKLKSTHRKTERQTAAGTDQTQKNKNTSAEADGSQQKSLSPLEQMKLQAAKIKKKEKVDVVAQSPVATVTDDGKTTPLSPAEQLRQTAVTNPSQASKTASTKNQSAAKRRQPAKTAPGPAAVAVSASAEVKLSEFLSKEHKQKLQEFYVSQIRPYLLRNESWRLTGHRGTLGDIHVANRTFERVAAEFPDEVRPVLDHLRSLVSRRTDLYRQAHMRWWLHAWLIVHVPATVVLFVLTFTHAFMALRVIPLSF